MFKLHEKVFSECNWTILFISTVKWPTILQAIDFPRYKMKCSVKNEILYGIFRVVSRFPLPFLLYLGNLVFFLDSAFPFFPALENVMHIQNIPRQNVLGTNRPKGQNVPRDKMSQGTKRPKGQNVPRDKTSQDKTSQDIRSQGQNVPGTKRPRDKTSKGPICPKGKMK